MAVVNIRFWLSYVGLLLQTRHHLVCLLGQLGLAFWRAWNLLDKVLEVSEIDGTYKLLKNTFVERTFELSARHIFLCR